MGEEEKKEQEAPVGTEGEKKNPESDTAEGEQKDSTVTEGTSMELKKGPDSPQVGTVGSVLEEKLEVSDHATENEKEEYRMERDERLPEFFIRHIGKLVTKLDYKTIFRNKQKYWNFEPQIEEAQGALWQQAEKKHLKDVGALLDYLKEEENREKEKESEQSLHKEGQMKSVTSDLGESLSLLQMKIAESANRGDPEVPPDLIGLELTPEERARLHSARKNVAEEEKSGKRKNAPPERFVQKLLEQNIILIFASSKCPFCARLQYLFEMHNRKYKMIRLDRMEDYGKDVFMYLLQNWMEIKAPNLYFHGRHIEVEDLEGVACELNVMRMDPVNSDPSFFDLIVVGAGQVGMAAALAAADLKKKVCLINCTEVCEDRKSDYKLGPLGLRLGSLTRKYFYQIAIDLLKTNEASFYGWQERKFGINWPFLVKQVSERLKKLEWEYRLVIKRPWICYLNCNAELLDKETVEVRNEEGTKVQLRGRRILLAVPAAAYIPQIPGRELCLTSEELLLRQRVPGSTLIVGGSLPGLELAFIISQLGFPVTLLVSGTLMNSVDKEVAMLLTGKLKMLGIKLISECLILRVDLLKSPTKKEGFNKPSFNSYSESFQEGMKTGFDPAWSSENAQNDDAINFDGKKGGKGKKGKGKEKGKKGKKESKLPPKKEEPKPPEESESQKALRKKNFNLFKLIKKITTTKWVAGDYYIYPSTKQQKPHFPGEPELGVVGIFGDGTLHTGTYNTVVFASGEVTSTESYGFKNAGINLDIGTGKVLVNEKNETNIPNIYAVGDIAIGNSHGVTATVAKATQLVKRIFGGAERVEGRLGLAPEVYLLPPLEYAKLGLSEETARARFQNKISVNCRWFWPLPSAFLQDHSAKNFIKLITLHLLNKDEEVIGVHIVGRNAGAALLGLALPMKNGLFLKDLENLIPIDYSNAEELAMMVSRVCKYNSLKNLEEEIEEEVEEPILPEDLTPVSEIKLGPVTPSKPLRMPFVQVEEVDYANKVLSFTSAVSVIALKEGRDRSKQ